MFSRLARIREACCSLRCTDTGLLGIKYSISPSELGTVGTGSGEIDGGGVVGNVSGEIDGNGVVGSGDRTQSEEKSSKPKSSIASAM